MRSGFRRDYACFPITFQEDPIVQIKRTQRKKTRSSNAKFSSEDFPFAAMPFHFGFSFRVKLRYENVLVAFELFQF